MVGASIQTSVLSSPVVAVLEKEPGVAVDTESLLHPLVRVKRGHGGASSSSRAHTLVYLPGGDLLVRSPPGLAG